MALLVKGLGNIGGVQVFLMDLNGFAARQLSHIFVDCVVKDQQIGGIQGGTGLSIQAAAA